MALQNFGRQARLAAANTYRNIPDKIDVSPLDTASPQIDRIPRTVHFIYSGNLEITWIQWLAVRAAIVNLGAQEVKIWLDTRLDPRGDIWERISRMDKVTVNIITMPTVIHGAQIPNVACQSDVLRLQILFDQGGIYLDNDLIALKSSDDVLDDSQTRPTVMTRRLDHGNVPNWMIMSKPQAPFLQRLLLAYSRADELNSWQDLTLMATGELASNSEDLTILEEPLWVYPLAGDKEADSILKKTWFGNSWEEIDKSYGTRLWQEDENLRMQITPHTVDVIDTALFCKVRPLFEDLYTDRDPSSSRRDDSRCAVARIQDLHPENHRMFADFQSGAQAENIKWVDSSGFHNNGWAPAGTALKKSQGTRTRSIDKDSYAVLPVPSGWDAREWSIRMQIKFDASMFEKPNGFGLFTIRNDPFDDIVIGFKRQKYPSSFSLDFDWNDKPPMQDTTNPHVMGRLEEGWIPTDDLQPLQEAPHEISVTYDAVHNGEASIYLDGSLLATQNIGIRNTSRAGQDVWVNARDWHNMDLGLRGSLQRFTMFADALPEKALQPNCNTSFGSIATTVDDAKSPDLFVGIPKLFLVLLCILWMMTFVRSRKAISRNLPNYATAFTNKARQNAHAHYPV